MSENLTNSVQIKGASIFIAHSNQNAKILIFIATCSQSKAFCVFTTYVKNYRKTIKIIVNNKNYCIDCGTEISKNSKRCIKCNNIEYNKYKFEVTKEKLEELINNNSYLAIGRMFGVSDNAIRKRAKKLGIKI